MHKRKRGQSYFDIQIIMEYVQNSETDYLRKTEFSPQYWLECSSLILNEAEALVP